MATYLQGVTDYIPDYQPFQPDLNFYGNVMQTKQNQYDTNWQSLNNLYGQLYGADLTHDKNIEKKDHLLKQIDFNLKRVSGLDLSLEQNVTQAMQVFKPFYEDKYLMKDMAYTKNWKSTYSSANALKNSQDPTQRKQWWGTGIQGLELRRQMFKDATLDETLNMGNAKYTPFVNATQEYMDLAKKYDIGAVQTIPDESGLYLVRKKNGDLILPTLQNTFLAEYSNRPDIQDMYREKAFVERMNYASQNADKFGGNKLEAEKEYIKDKYDWLKSYASNKNVKAQDDLSTTKSLQGNLEKEVNAGNVNPQQLSYADRLNQALKINGAVADDAEKLNNQINDKQATTTVQGYDEDILGDIELARLKVDAGFASVAAEQDIMTAANRYASLNMEVEYKANPVGLEFLRDKNARARQSQGHQDRLGEIQAQNDAKMYQKAVDFNLAKGYYSFDKDNKLVTNPQANGFGINFITPDGYNGGEVMSIDGANKFFKDQMMTQNATEPVNNLMKFINNGVTSMESGNSFTAAQLAKMVIMLNPSNPLAKTILKEGSKNYKPDIIKVWNGIWNDYKSNPNEFITRHSTAGTIFQLNKVMQSWTAHHSGSALAQEYFKDPSMIKLDQLSRTNDALNIVRDNNFDKIKNKFTQDLNYIVSNVKDKDPVAFKNVTDAKVNQAIDLMMNRYIYGAHGNTDEFKAMAPEIDKQIASILGFSIGKSTNQKAETKWYNYVFPLTNLPRILGDGREDVKDKASWVADVFDNSFEELAKDMNPETGLQTYAAKGTKRSGNQVSFAAETGNMMVAPGIAWDPGNQSASQMFSTILSTNWNQDKNKFRVTTGGNKLPGSDEEWDDTGVSQNEAIAIVREMQARLNTDNEMKPFMVGATRGSMESNGLGSMKLMAPRDVIEKVIKGMAGEDATEMDLKTKIDDIYQKGITFIAPSTIWDNNKLYGNQFPTPTEILLRQGPIKYDDPAGNGRYTIEKTPGSGDYSGVGEYYEMKDDGSKIIHTKYLAVDVKSGRTIEEKEQGMNSLINQASAFNYEMFKKIHQSGDQKAIQNAQTNFGITSTSPFWQYNK
jgi:hypothetical protein